MKLKDKCKSIPFDTPIDVSKIKGHVTIELFDKETGEVVERREGHNFLTNAIQQYFKNCGFMNFPNVNQSNMVEELMGGVMGFDTALGDSVNTVHVPAGVKMTFNGSVGAVNSGQTPSEMGSYISDDSGWQENGSYLQVYEFQTGQANGTIAAVCTTGKNYAYCGEGNATSNVRHATGTNISNLCGSVTSHSGIPGYVFHFDFTDSSCYSFNIETIEDVKKGVLRKYRLPISKLNLKGTPAAPICLSEELIQLDSDLANSSYIQTQEDNGKLIIWNIQLSGDYAWGSGWTQYVWTVETNGTITKQTITNTSGVSDLRGLQAAIFDGDYCFFVNAWAAPGSGTSYGYFDTTTIYVLRRSTGAITTIPNSAGNSSTITAYGKEWRGAWPNRGWNLAHGTGDGRIVTNGNVGGFVVDAVKGAVYVNNAGAGTYGNSSPANGLIRHVDVNLYRDQTYIATIFNLDTPVEKTNTQSMRVTYRLTFDEEEGTNS